MSAMGAASVKAAATLAPREDLDALHALLGRPADSAERVGTGRNSRVYKVRCGEAEYAAKFYFKPTADGRDRLQVEYSGLEFLWQRGVRSIAQPVRADAGRQVALYQFVHGEPVASSDASAGDIDQLLSFVAALKAIKADEQTRSLNPAAEAFFTVAGVISNLHQRLARLEALDAQGGLEYVPTVSPWAISRRVIICDVEPLPLVPVTWITGYVPCGSPITDISRWIVSSDGASITPVLSYVARESRYASASR